ncbi:MAG TPA: hypothetical protein VGP64_04280 [Polyangia bacterium]|jgi:hypothetical protein
MEALPKLETPPEMMTSETQVAVARADSPVLTDLDPVPMASIWDGILREFRNHLTVLLAVAGEIRTTSPAAGVGDVAAALADAEGNVHRLDALVGFVDAALRDGTKVIADLDDVLERALRLAAPVLGRTSVSLHKDRRTGIANRGTALEALLAALLVELCQAGGRDREATADRPHTIGVYVEATRGAMYLSVESDGRRPAPGGWRFALACDLGARLGATVAALPDTAGYLVRFS